MSGQEKKHRVYHFI
jgi:hypothetical protein